MNSLNASFNKCFKELENIKKLLDKTHQELEKTKESCRTIKNISNLDSKKTLHRAPIDPIKLFPLKK